MLFRKRRKIKNTFVEPDEIFLDSQNLPDFDTQQMEGRLERPIPKSAFFFVFGLLGLFLVIFSIKLLGLQVFSGSDYAKQSEKNRLAREPIFADRGVIYDRNNVELVWNNKSEIGEPFANRVYIKEPGFSHILGYVSYPSKDAQGVFWQTEHTPRDGVERTFNDQLQGTNGMRLVEKRSDTGDTVPTSEVVPAIAGNNVVLSIDSVLQKKLYKALATSIQEMGYQGGSALMMNVRTGEMLAMTNYPEYDSSLLSKGDDKDLIQTYLTDSRKPFLNRAISGLYSPGSIIKPFIALGALQEGIVTPTTKILSRGSIKIPNPYRPGEYFEFKDYRPDNGWVDLPNALRVSSNIYFYNVVGGYGSQKGMGIANEEKYVRMFGIGSKSGIPLIGEKEGTIPNPEWKAKNFNGDIWRIGDSYNTAIGQYGFQVTPLQMLRAVASIANRGSVLVPSLTKTETPLAGLQKLPFPDSFYDPIHEGMRLVVTSGTSTVLKSVPFLVSAKTGTAQVGKNNEYVNAWIMGFYPSDKPEYAFVVLMDRGSAAASLAGGQRVMKYFFDDLVASQSQYVTPYIK